MRLHTLLSLVLLSCPVFCQVGPNLLKNESFEEPFAADGRPNDWAVYGGLSENRTLKASQTARTGKQSLQMEDQDISAELGVTQTVAAEPNRVYRASVWIHAVERASSAGAHLQMRFLPSGQFRQVSLVTRPGLGWRQVRVTGSAPADTRQIIIYLYCHRDPMPRLLLDDVELVAGAELEEEVVVPAPVPPEIKQVKDRNLATPLVAGGRPICSIISPADCYQPAAQRIQAAVEQITGVKVPILTDQSEAAAVPLAGHVILLGNRSTNQAVRKLYDLYFTLLDLKYPGPGGHVVRSVHNPFGNGFNALFVGGSDDPGVEAAADALIASLRTAGGRAGELSVGWLMATRLSDQYDVPEDLKQVAVWEASDGYGSSGYFGWNSISKRMALYYMTGDEASAREALRLAFPDQRAKDELAATDGEMIENKDAPLSGPYHYNAHMMILFWDLIEESPLFSDEERLSVTRAFANQLLHRKDEGVYPLTEPPRAVGSRHGQYSAVSLYCLARYFQAHYPDPVWKQALRGSMLHFAPLHESAYVAGESDNLFWYNTATAPIITYLALSGDREAIASGAVPALLKGQEALVSGRIPDWALRYGALDYFNKLAYLTGDGRWIEYRNRTAQPTGIFRLGQSFWPEPTMQPALPTDLVGTWTVNSLPDPAWVDRGNGFPVDESFYFASYRSAPDATGDFILLDGFNGASRNPYHSFAILELRIGGQTILKAGNGAYLNQVQTKADGMVEPRIAMDAALRERDVLGDTVAAVGEVPEMSFANWRRSIIQRVGRFALVVDDLTFRADSDNMEVKTLWQPGSAHWDGASQAIRVPLAEPAAAPPGWRRFGAWSAPISSQPGGKELVSLDTWQTKLVRSTAPGDFIEMTFTTTEPLEGEWYADLLNYSDRGVVSFQLDGQKAGELFDPTSPEARLARAPLGRRRLPAGEHRLRVEVAQVKEGRTQAYIGLAGVSLRPDGAPAADAAIPSFEIRMADVLPVEVGGGAVTSLWRGAARKDGQRTQFSLIAPADPAAACLRLSDNAAALALPEPGLVVVGERGATKAALAVLQPSHLYARAATQVGLDQALLTASAPIHLDWQLDTGRLVVEAAEAATVTVAGGAAQQLAPGRHTLTARPAADLTAALAGLLAEAKGIRAQALAQQQGTPKPTGAPLAAAWSAAVGGKPADVALGDQQFYVATGNTVHVLDPAGKAVRKLSTAGNIRVLHWWPEARLLLVGCVDEKVVAFDAEGNRKWEFTSVMDPAVFRAAKQYWFKTAPGHEGIHGLGSGPFIDGQSQAFVGSACTVEILNPDGSLAKRLPVFWGPGTILKTMPAADGTTNLLIARWLNDGHALAVINSKTLDPNPRSYYGVPPGHDYVSAWSGQNRNHLFIEDLDADGKLEVASEVNGTWNRVTVWDAAGAAVASANFGPGPAAPFKTVRALDVTDLDGDGRKELVVAVVDGLVVALDAKCQPLWSKRLASPAATLTAAPGAKLVLGCDDGSVVVLDGRGEVLRVGKVDSRPAEARLLPNGTVLLATDKGQVTAVEP